MTHTSGALGQIITSQQSSGFRLLKLSRLRIMLRTHLKSSLQRNAASWKKQIQWWLDHNPLIRFLRPKVVTTVHQELAQRQILTRSRCLTDCRCNLVGPDMAQQVALVSMTTAIPLAIIDVCCALLCTTVTETARQLTYQILLTCLTSRQRAHTHYILPCSGIHLLLTMTCSTESTIRQSNRSFSVTTQLSDLKQFTRERQVFLMTKSQSKTRPHSMCKSPIPASSKMAVPSNLRPFLISSTGSKRLSIRHD